MALHREKRWHYIGLQYKEDEESYDIYGKGMSEQSNWSAKSWKKREKEKKMKDEQVFNKEH